VYKNETFIGDTLHQLRDVVPRSSLYLTTKLAPVDMKSTDSAYSAAVASVDRLQVQPYKHFDHHLYFSQTCLGRLVLQTPYVDLFLLHWPGVSGIPVDSPENAQRRIDAWRALERLHDAGVARAIGVSNFNERHLAGLLPQCRVRPVVNQVLPIGLSVFYSDCAY
jgi:diketogulonate reductase-like aldo/keto reductase